MFIYYLWVDAIMIRDIKTLVRRLNGTQTIESTMAILSVNRIRAIKYISRLRKQGYVKTKRLSNNKRVYSISFENRLGGSSYYDILNESSPIKIRASEVYNIYGKTPSIEETLVFAVKTKSLRTILASLALFKKIKCWPELYRLSKASNIERQIGALYDLSRKIMKTRKMTKRFINFSLPKRNAPYEHIIRGLSSNNFKDIERRWRVYLPFNKSDLEDYE